MFYFCGFPRCEGLVQAESHTWPQRYASVTLMQNIRMTPLWCRLHHYRTNIPLNFLASYLPLTACPQRTYGKTGSLSWNLCRDWGRTVFGCRLLADVCWVMPVKLSIDCRNCQYLMGTFMEWLLLETGRSSWAGWLNSAITSSSLVIVRPRSVHMWVRLCSLGGFWSPA